MIFYPSTGNGQSHEELVSINYRQRLKTKAEMLGINGNAAELKPGQTSAGSYGQLMPLRARKYYRQR
jgi:hypothetical protein